MKGYRPIPASGHITGGGILCCNMTLEEQQGASQTVVLNQEKPQPIIVSGWSKAVGVDGAPDNGYSVYVDVEFTDGTALYGQTAVFSTGSHDWELRQRIFDTSKPIRRLTTYALFRNHRGSVYFDDFSVMTLPEQTVLFDGRPIYFERPQSKPSDNPVSTSRLITHTGLEIKMDTTTNSVMALDLRHKRVGCSTLPVSFVRDVAADSDFCAPETWEMTEPGVLQGDVSALGLRMHVSYQRHKDYVEVAGQVENLNTALADGKGDRAVTVYQALPVQGNGWYWADDFRHSRSASQGTFINEVPTGVGATGTRSLYPFATLSGSAGSIGVAVPIDDPRHHRIAYNADTQLFYVAIDLGLSRDTLKSPNGATWRMRIMVTDPASPFRAMMRQYHQMYPEAFDSKLVERGNWLAFTDMATIPQSDDFGFAFHEGTNNVAWDDAHGIRSFIYTEPMTTWMPMPKETPKNYDKAIEQLNAAMQNPHEATSEASKTLLSGARTQDDRFVVSVGDTPWCSGAVFALDADPDLPVCDLYPKNQAQYLFEMIDKEMTHATSNHSEVDGVYVDSYEFWATTLNYNRAHFASADIPLVYDAQSHAVGLLTVFSTFEFQRALVDKMHNQGKYVLTNIALNNFDFSAYGLDVLGTETNWFPNGKWEPLRDSELMFRRALSWHRPYCFLLNTHYANLTGSDIERYMQRCLFYAMFPGFFSENAATDCFFQTPKWYESARSLFKRYMPLIRMVEKAQWQPMTNAQTDNSDILVERYGSEKDHLFFTLLNDTPDYVETNLRFMAKGVGCHSKEIALKEHLTGSVLMAQRVGQEYVCPVALPAQSTRVFELIGTVK